MMIVGFAVNKNNSKVLSPQIRIERKTDSRKKDEAAVMVLCPTLRSTQFELMSIVTFNSRWQNEPLHNIS